MQRQRASVSSATLAMQTASGCSQERGGGRDHMAHPLLPCNSGVLRSRWCARDASAPCSSVPCTVGTALAGVGLLYTTVSVYQVHTSAVVVDASDPRRLRRSQLVRCTVIIVTAILRYSVLKHRYTAVPISVPTVRCSLATYAWFGLFINTLGKRQGYSLVVVPMRNVFVAAMILVSSTSFIQLTADDEAYGDPRYPTARSCACLNSVFHVLQSRHLVHSDELRRARSWTIAHKPCSLVHRSLLASCPCDRRAVRV